MTDTKRSDALSEKVKRCAVGWRVGMSLVTGIYQKASKVVGSNR